MEEELVRIRRFVMKAIQHLFVLEANTKQAFREIAGRAKKLVSQQMMEGRPPLSELITQATAGHLNKETLSGTPEESYRMEHESICRWV